MFVFQSLVRGIFIVSMFVVVIVYIGGFELEIRVYDQKDGKIRFIGYMGYGVRVGVMLYLIYIFFDL